MAKKPQTTPPIGPKNKASAPGKIDGRRWEAKLLEKTRAELIAHCGGKPSATQRALIDRVAWLTLHITIIDRRAADGPAMTADDAERYLAFSNALARTIARIGLKSAASAPPSLREHMAARAGGAAP